MASLLEIKSVPDVLIPPQYTPPQEERDHLSKGQVRILAAAAEEKGATQAMVDLFRKSYQYQISEGKYDYIPSIKYHRELVNNYEAKFNKPHGYLITINPKPEADDDLLERKILKFLDKAWVHDGVLSREFRNSEDRLGKHIHCYVRYNGKRYSQVVDETYNTFKTLVGNKQHVNVKRIKQVDEDQVVKYVIKDGDFQSFGIFKQSLTPIPEIIFED